MMNDDEIAMPLDWAEYVTVLQLETGVKLDAEQLRRAIAALQRVQAVVSDATPAEVLAGLRTDLTLHEFANALENVLRG